VGAGAGDDHALIRADVRDLGCSCVLEELLKAGGEVEIRGAPA
jgi:hypothetical protein